MREKNGKCGRTKKNGECGKWTAKWGLREKDGECGRRMERDDGCRRALSAGEGWCVLVKDEK